MIIVVTVAASVISSAAAANAADCLPVVDLPPVCDALTPLVGDDPLVPQGQGGQQGSPEIGTAKVIVGSTTASSAVPAGASGAVAAASAPSGASFPVGIPGRPALRAFSNTSYWNTPLPAAAPLHSNSSGIVSFLAADNSTNHVLLSGTDSTGHGGQPVYWAKTGDPTYNVVQTRRYTPPEFRNLRIPAGARPDPTSDSELTVYDLDRGYVAGLWDAHFNAQTNTWSAGGGEIFYLDSNGLDGSLPESDEARNGGAHRGLPPSTFAIRHDEIQSGAINHVLKIGVNNTYHRTHVWPMTGDEPGVTNANAPVEGSRIRIKPSVNLASLGLTAPAFAIATALQRYGAIVGDQTGGPVELKTENTVAEGRGQLWSGLLSSGSLSAIPMTMYEVIQDGYRPAARATPPVPSPPSPSPSPSPTPPEPATSPVSGSESSAAASSEEIEVIAPTRGVVRARWRLPISWVAGDPAGFARLDYHVRGSDHRPILERTPNDGGAVWRIPGRLRGERIRIEIHVFDTGGQLSRDRSAWFRVR